jgi:signal transduction histidine kinase
MRFAGQRGWPPSSMVVDLLVVTSVAVPTAMDAWWNAPGTRQADWVTYLLLAVSLGALGLRRRWPLGVAVVCGAALTGWYALGHEGELLNLPTMVALYTVAVEGDRRRTVVVGVGAAVWSVGLAELFDDPVVGSPMFEILWPLVPLLFGEVVRGRRELRRAYAARAARAEADRELEARRRVGEERLRIAREFHDVVAHTMAAVNVQMGVAVAAFEAHPEAARDALRQARASSREALQELRATVALLRDPSGTESATPAPTLTNLNELAERADQAGVSVTLTGITDGHELPAVIEVTVYRIVQEALTNVIRHANAEHAQVVVTVDDDALVVDVSDDGRPRHRAATPIGPNQGFGLVGMTERAAAVDGRIEFGRVAGGGFRVHAVLPLGGRRL